MNTLVKQDYNFVYCNDCGDLNPKQRDIMRRMLKSNIKEYNETKDHKKLLMLATLLIGSTQQI